jgi:hypothetical protein
VAAVAEANVMELVGWIAAVAETDKFYLFLFFFFQFRFKTTIILINGCFF